jgi:putative restriction endonuclease
VADEDLRIACFASLDVLSAAHGPDVPYRGGLIAGFDFKGVRVPFLSPQKGIFRAKVQQGGAALSVVTSYKSPYDDRETADGFIYAYRAGDIDQPDNRALRDAFLTAAPIVYFVGTRPGVYRPIYPCFVTGDDRAARAVVLTPGRLLADREADLPDDPLERRYAVREAKVRLHQARFRGRVVPAYSNQCSICRLKEPRLLDAAHIVPDADSRGIAGVANGLCLCTIHHRAFDERLVGITPDYEIRVHPRLLDDEDGPMLDVLKRAHATLLTVPARRSWQPDRELLAIRFDRFASA